MQTLLDRLSAIEEQQKSSVAALKKNVVQYTLRRNVDFDKYKALELVDQLRTLAIQLKDAKADYFNSVHTTLLDKLPHSSPELFKAYILSLLGDRDYEKIVETIKKVDKSFASTTAPKPGYPYPQPLFSQQFNQGPQRFPAFQTYTTAPNFPRTPWRSRHCTYCGLRNHTSHICYKRLNNERHYANKK